LNGITYVHACVTSFTGETLVPPTKDIMRPAASAEVCRLTFYDIRVSTGCQNLYSIPKGGGKKVSFTDLIVKYEVFFGVSKRF